jgi:hypothetical protein
VIVDNMIDRLVQASLHNVSFMLDSGGVQTPEEVRTTIIGLVDRGHLKLAADGTAFWWNFWNPKTQEYQPVPLDMSAPPKENG